MNRYFCPKCGATLSKGNMYALWDTHGLKHLKCCGCANDVITIDAAMEKIWDKVMCDEEEE